MKNENYVVAEENKKVDSSSLRPQFLAVSPLRLVFLSVITVGWYKFYWFYKNWKAISDSGEQLTPRPLFRSVFAPFFAYGLFKRVFSDSSNNGYEGYYSSGWLAVLYLMLISTSAILSFRYGVKYPVENFYLKMIHISSVMALIPVQKAINFRSDIRKNFSLGELFVIALGIISIVPTILLLSGVGESLFATN